MSGDASAGTSTAPVAAATGKKDDQDFGDEVMVADSSAPQEGLDLLLGAWLLLCSCVRVAPLCA